MAPPPSTTVPMVVQSRFRVNGQPATRWVQSGSDSPPVPSAKVSIQDGAGGVLAVTTVNQYGKGSLELKNVADGTYSMTVEAPSQQRSTQETNAKTTCTAKRAYRDLQLTVTIQKNAVTRVGLADPTDIHGSALLNAKTLDIDLKPDFLEYQSASRQGKSPDAIIVHHTGDSIGSALNTWANGIGPHFVIDLDGFTLMTTECSKAAGHAGTSYWNGILGHDLNRTTIGIEIVNGKGQPYTTAQYDRLLVLLDDLCTALSIPKHHVIGHQDIATDKGDPKLHDNRRADDPGPLFDWGKLTAKGFGMQLTRATPAPAVMYDGAFASPSINQKPKPPQKLSPKHGSAKAIKELQADLAAIGHFVKQSGVYDKYTEAAVLYFELHFDGRSIGFGKYVDPQTALKIKRCTVW